MNNQEKLAKYLEIDSDDLTIENYDHYGLEVYSANGEEYAIGTDKECDDAAKQNILDSLWAFNAEFIASHSKALDSEEAIKALKEMQGKLCESANSIILALINDIDHFIEDVIRADGRGHFISHYDSEEIEIDSDTYAYRIN